jgi:hypothetical protein
MKRLLALGLLALALAGGLTVGSGVVSQPAHACGGSNTAC